ncbi:AGE family epimerase/isomerase [Litoreibacter janthinus]|uniref:Mannose-6-phosphate isomerase n=1 Tax=Litoreibacter janthinus TaxID=670154 RepID=A0A1I6GQR0_9RHOB|nr:AGE family epimerase/isomerase [Litoreibacter janthinus]SFR44377.1 mannose-6-phosphate isomerase [Litoreibacter janthinus]
MPSNKTDAMESRSPDKRDATDWSRWFWQVFLKDWLVRVQDGQYGVFDALDDTGAPDIAAGKSVLAQARTLFTLSHIALLFGDPEIVSAARRQVAFLDTFRNVRGLYRNRTQRDGTPTGKDEDDVARSYDQTFVILGLVTWNNLSPSDEVSRLIDDCWSAIQTHLTDPDTGLLLNDDTGEISNPAQNPHMHLYEACLQANRMTGDALWLTRAAELRGLGLQYFMDQSSGSIAEFLTPDLSPLPGADGHRREVGHQCEWAWLLLEEADLASTPALAATAMRLSDFADSHGFAQDGILKGAAYYAVSDEGKVAENSFLLWPQTEAIKLLAHRYMAGDQIAGDRARAMLCLMFERWFSGRPSYINQLGSDGQVLWPAALTRLMYHVVLAMTEGARAGLWAGNTNCK